MMMRTRSLPQLKSEINQVIHSEENRNDKDFLEEVNALFGEGLENPKIEEPDIVDVTITQTNACGVYSIKKGPEKRVPNNRKRNRHSGALHDKYQIVFEGLGLSRECVRAAQTEDKECSDIVTFITQKQLPKDSDRARRLLIK